MTDDGLPPLRDVITAHGLDARRSLGQNFLLDLNLTRRIARVCPDLKDHDVLEVGPGPGGLTRALLLEGARRVVAIERDHRASQAIAEIAAAYPDRVHLVEADALEVNEEDLLEGRTHIVANLPYNISTALLLKWLAVAPWPGWPLSLTLMFQREVAERIVAEPGSKSYGRLSVVSQWRTRAHIAFDVSPKAFTPQPKVVSSVVHMTPKAPAPNDPQFSSLERVTAAAFGQRRKMLRASLKQVFADPMAICEAVGIDPTARAEQVSVDGFLSLAQQLER